MKQFLVEKAIEACNNSTYDRQHVGAVIFKQKRILSTGFNCISTRRNLHPSFQNYKYSIHAEVDAILKAKKDLAGSEILVVRLNKKGEFRLSKPCEHCMMYIEHVGIKRVWYSISIYPFFESLKIRS